MASTLAEYYGRAKSGFGNIESAEMAQLGEDWLVTAATGAGIGMLSAALGGLDHEIAGFPVPLDGLVSVGLGYAGLSMGGETGEMLKIASIAAGGSAAVRTFEGFFRKGFGTKVKGEFEELGHSGFAQRNLLPGFGFGQSAQDRLVEAAKYL